MDLILIRHGQSFANRDGLLISNADDNLTPKGESQSCALKKIIKELEIMPDMYFVSPWKRARQTAEIIFPSSISDIFFDSRLAETNPGSFGSWKEAAFNKEYPTFNCDIRNKYLGGESHLEMAIRVQDWVTNEVLSRASQSGVICAVTHGGPISVVIQYLLGIPLEGRYPSFAVENASFTILRWRKSESRYCVERVGNT